MKETGNNYRGGNFYRTLIRFLLRCVAMMNACFMIRSINTTAMKVFPLKEIISQTDLYLVICLQKRMF